MFSNKVTLFNYDETNNFYYSTLLTNVELQSNYRTNFTDESTVDNDLTLLIVKYRVENGTKKVQGTEKSFLTPKVWESTQDKSGVFTIQSGRDFFVKGDLTNLNDIDYEELKNTYDDVFFIQSVKDFEDDLKHFEILGY